MKLMLSVHELESFFKRMFPGLEYYESNSSNSVSLISISFVWEKQSYNFYINNQKVVIYGENSSLMELLVQKQIQIDELSKK